MKKLVLVPLLVSIFFVSCNQDEPLDMGEAMNRIMMTKKVMKD